MKIKSMKSKAVQSPFDGELVNLDTLEGGTLQKYGQDVADQLIKSAFLPRLQLMTGNSDRCKKGLFPVNKFALVSGQDFRDVGAEVDVLVLVWRPKALDTNAEEMIVSHDITDPEFVRIQESSEEKDSGCMYGQEFLVYLPEQAQFATFFMGTKTSRREAPNMLALCRKAATLKAGEIKTKRYTYYSPSVTKCSTEFTLPSKEDCLEQVEEFNNPKVQTVERTEVDDAAPDVRG